MTTTEWWLTQDEVEAITHCSRAAEVMDQRGGKRVARRLRRTADQIRTTARHRLSLTAERRI